MLITWHSHSCMSINFFQHLVFDSLTLVLQMNYFILKHECCLVNILGTVLLPILHSMLAHIDVHDCTTYKGFHIQSQAQKPHAPPLSNSCQTSTKIYATSGTYCSGIYMSLEISNVVYFLGTTQWLFFKDTNAFVDHYQCNI